MNMFLGLRMFQSNITGKWRRCATTMWWVVVESCDPGRACVRAYRYVYLVQCAMQ